MTNLNNYILAAGEGKSQKKLEALKAKADEGLQQLLEDVKTFADPKILSSLANIPTKDVSEMTKALEASIATFTETEAKAGDRTQDQQILTQYVKNAKETLGQINTALDKIKTENNDFNQ